MCMQNIPENDLRVATRLRLSEDPVPASEKVMPGSKQDVFVNAYMHWQCYWASQSTSELKKGQQTSELFLQKQIANFSKLPEHNQQQIAQVWTQTVAGLLQPCGQSEAE